MNNWIDKNIEMPQRKYEFDSTIYVLVTDGKEIGIGQYYYEYKYWVYTFAGFIEKSDNLITHWMNLPNIND